MQHADLQLAVMTLHEPLYDKVQRLSMLYFRLDPNKSENGKYNLNLIQILNKIEKRYLCCVVSPMRNILGGKCMVPNVRHLIIKLNCIYHALNTHT